MSDQPLQTRIAAVGTDGYVTADEVLFLRRSVFEDGIASTTELDCLFDLAKRAPDGDAEWQQFFAEVAADFYLREEDPQGYLTDIEFESLQARIERHGAPNTLDIFLLIKLMETAVETPAAMAAYTGEQLKRSILEKEGGAFVEKNDAMLLRRYLFACGGAGNVGVTREEAELLFDINDATANAHNNPAWTELFVQGIINHLMAHLGYSAPSREEAFRRNAWVRDQSVDVGGFFKRMAAGAFDAFRFTKDETVTEQNNAERAAGAAQAKQITEDESRWLATRIGRDGGFDINEQKLVERMRDLEADLPKELKELLSRAA